MDASIEVVEKVAMEGVLILAVGVKTGKFVSKCTVGDPVCSEESTPAAVSDNNETESVDVTRGMLASPGSVCASDRDGIKFIAGVIVFVVVGIKEVNIDVASILVARVTSVLAVTAIVSAGEFVPVN